MIVSKLNFFFESPNDRTTCPVIHGFAQTMFDSDRTLSVDRPLFQALTRDDKG